MPQEVVNFMKANAIVGVKLECPASEKPQQILASPPIKKKLKVQQAKPVLEQLHRY